ncbi:TonB-dependent receptor domain-containing protein [Neisseria sp. Ec49-e6-T10]|uniref:TonB-dependent receptor domain-containing protein n=1 Tax=Neisseria sp. Ec49-e6-T10 TaxID=3140744 RepID=UPI003EBAD00B
MHHYSFRLKSLTLSVFLGLNCFSLSHAQNEQVGLAQIDDVVVTASGFEQKIKDAPASISVITRQDLEGKSFHNIGDALKNVEGISVDRGGKAGGLNISIRGMPSSYTLILIDGKRMSAGGEASRPNGFSDVDTSFIPPLSAIERIEVIRGPMSTLYGSDAMGGVINIITRKVGKQWTGSIKASATIQEESKFGDDLSSTLFVSGPIKEDLLGLTLRGGVYHRDNHKIHYTEADGSDKRLGFSGLGKEDDYNIGFRLAFTPTKDHDIILDLDNAKQTFANNQNQLGTQNVKGKVGGGYADQVKFKRDRYSLSHTGRWGWGVSDSSILYDTTQTIGRVNPVDKKPAPTDGKARDIKYSTLTIDSKWTVPLFDFTHQATFGGQYWHQRLKDTLAKKPKDYFNQYQWALFVEDKWQITDDLALTGGVRYDENQVFGGHWSPRGYLVWSATPMFTFKGGVSKGYKTPELNKMIHTTYNYGQQGQLPLVGNADLKPETSTTSELGMIFDNNQGFSTNLTVYQTDFKDKIESQRYGNCEWSGGSSAGCINAGVGSSFKQVSLISNVGKVRVRGLEWGMRYNINQDWQLTGNYAYTRSKQKSEGVEQGHPIGSEARNIINAKVKWQINQPVNVWLAGQYREKQYAGLIHADESFYKSYAVFDAGINYTLTKNLNISAVIYNLGNKNFIQYGPSRSDATATTYSNAYYQILEGRRLWLSAEYTF